MSHKLGKQFSHSSFSDCGAEEENENIRGCELLNDELKFLGKSGVL